jgi:flagellar hook-associated protein 3 FlgL
MIRISTATAYESSVANLQRRQAALTDAQVQLTSGKRVLRPSDDPAAAAQVERALAAGTRAEGQKRALDSARTSMALSESALGEAGNVLQQARELVVAAGNGSFTDGERKTVAENLRGLRNDLLAIANRGDGSGRYLFGGQGSDGQPMLDAPGGVDYGGTSGGMQAATGEAMPLSLDGRAVWLQAPDPRNPGASVSVFNVLDQAIADLSTTGRSSAQVADTVSAALAGIDASSSNLGNWRSAAGEALNRADSIGSRLSQAKLDAQVQRSDAEDLDMIEAVSAFQAKQSGYDAALKTYSMVQRMSLFDYIK